MLEDIRKRHSNFEYIHSYIDDNSCNAEWDEASKAITTLLSLIDKYKEEIHLSFSYSGLTGGYHIQMDGEDIYFSKDDYQARMFMAELKARIKIAKSEILEKE